MKAGHRRALRRLARALYRHRCPICVTDTRTPSIVPAGIVCLHCGWLDTSRDVVIDAVRTRSGFMWRAVLVDK